MTKTRAIRIHKTGGPDVLTEEEITLDAPAVGQVRVRNTATVSYTHLTLPTKA